jgi:hypothetical protein
VGQIQLSTIDTDSLIYNGRQNRPAPNNVFILLRGFGVALRFLFLNFVWCRRRISEQVGFNIPLRSIFKTSYAPQQNKHQRYAQCRGTGLVLRTLAHLLAAHSHATPKQAKEPKSNLILIY